METKRCNKCGKTKPMSDFYDYRKTTGDVYSKCRQCVSELNKHYYQMRRKKGAQPRIDHMKRICIRQRANALFRWIQHGEINETETQMILRNVKF